MPRRKFSRVWSGRHRDHPRRQPHFERLKAAAEGARREGAFLWSRAACRCASARCAAADAGRYAGYLRDLGDTRLCYTVAAPGEHWVINSLAVMAVVRAVGADFGAAGLAMAELEGLAGRGARLSPRPMAARRC
jgi:UDP-N-acetylmuramoyl-tripeptide--D-alanyl-D-alanine ligase